MEVEKYNSNVIMLPGRKPKKKQMKMQISDDVKAVSNAKLSKSQKKKLKRLEEEKDKATLLRQSIDTLEKCKLNSEVYSLMWSSRNLSQVETVREKRQREVHFSKAGIKLPYNYQPLKKRAIDNSAHEVEQHIDRIGVECYELTHKRREVPNNSSIYSLSTGDLNLRDGVGCPSGPAADENIFIKKLSKPEYLQKSLSSCDGDDDIGDFSGKVDDDKKVDHGSTSVLVNSPPGKSLGSSSTKEIEKVETCLDSSRFCANSLQERTLVPPPLVHVYRPEEVQKQREKLPVVMAEYEIMQAIFDNKSVIICGETGCGKTTQVPQFLYEAGYGSKHPDRRGLIGVTQPRRVAVLATAKRVAYELGLHLGKEVGFQVRHDKMIGDKSSIKFMTDGILLREIQNDFLLKRYSVIILDEAHERSLNTDILIGLLSRIVQERERQHQEQKNVDSGKYIINPENRISPLKLVLMSATLRVEDFVSGRKIFRDPPFVIDVPTRQYPVTIHFAKRTDTVDYVGQAYKKVMSIHKRLPPGGVLVFLTGQREVKYLCQKLCKASKAMIKNINEAFESRGSSNCEITDCFGSYDGDYDDLSGNESESSFDSEDDSDLELFKPDEDLLNQKSLDSNDFSGKAESEALVGKGTHDFGSGPMRVLPLYAMLPASEQLRVFEEVKEGERLVVVATNVAETSLTIPGIRYVVDTGREKVKKYNSSNGMEEYEIQWISKASAAQRAGRSGRTGPGHCYRLYSSSVFGNIFPEFSTAEILKVPVDGLVLLMKSMHIDKVANFPFPTPPEATSIAEAERCLKVLGALNSEGRLTTLGEAMAQYPMSPRHSRMLLTVILILRDVCSNGGRNLVLGHAVAAAAALSLPSPFTRGNHKEKDDDSGPAENRDEKSRKKKLNEISRANPASDVLTTAFALQCFELSTSPVEWCSDNALHLKTLEEMSKLRKQLLRIIFSMKMQSEFAWTHGGIDDVERAWRVPTEKYPLSENEEKILRKAICAGWADRVAKRCSTKQLSDGDRKVSNAVRYQACLVNETVFLHRSSSLSRCAPEFLVYSELLRTKRPYIRGATKVEAKWMVEYAPSMCTFSSAHAAAAAYDSEIDQVCCRAIPIFGPHLWQLGRLRHNLPVKDDLKRVSVFAVALLEGRVLPCMRSKSSLLAVKAGTIFRPDALGVKRAGNLLSKLLLLKIDSREKLRQLWEDDPRELFAEIRDWYQHQFHDEFEELWVEMQHEILSLTPP